MRGVLRTVVMAAMGLVILFHLDNSALANMGPLVYDKGKGYFKNASNDEYVYLTGSHTWNNFQDVGETDPPEAFDFDRHLKWLKSYNLNFIRLWVFEQAKGDPYREDIWIEPLPFERTGPGKALDGKLKFNLSVFNDRYFERLRDRVGKAAKEGFYVSVMLFQGWSIDRSYGNKKNPWDGHPFNKENNVNHINGDYYNHNGEGEEYHSLLDPIIFEIQKAYVRKVLDTLSDMDNVLYEISNEDQGKDEFWAQRHKEWQTALVSYIKYYEGMKKQQHPVGLTTTSALGNEWLWHSNADWVSPAHAGKSNCLDDIYKSNPPVTDGDKVVVLDTDHLWGIGGGRQWVWKAFLRGYNPIYMDNLQDVHLKKCRRKITEYHLPDARKNMGFTLEYAQKIGLAEALPKISRTSTTFCLENDSRRYLIYQPSAIDPVVVYGLRPGDYELETLDVKDGSKMSHRIMGWNGGDMHLYKPVHVERDWVVYLELKHR